MSRPICIIDDDEDIRGVMRFALEFEGLKCLLYAGGAEAEAALKSLPASEYPGLIVVDFMMPGMDGLAFMDRMKTLYPSSLGAIPMALSTARLTDEEAKLPSDVLHLEKPVDLQHFIELAFDHSERDLRFDGVVI